MANFWEELFPGLDNQEDIKEAIKVIKDLVEEYKVVRNELQGTAKSYKKDIKSIVDSTGSIKEAITTLNTSTKEGRDSLETLTKTVDIAAAEYSNLKKSVVALDGTMDDLTKEQEEFNKQAEITLKQEKELEKLIKKRDSLRTSEAKKIAEVKAEIQEQNKQLREQAKATLGIVKEQSKFSKNQDRIADALENTGDASKNAQSGVKGLGSQFKALLANPIVLVVSALAGLLVLLFDRFKKTAAGAELFAKAGAFVEGLLSELTGVVDGLIPFLAKLFEDPVQGIKELGMLLLDNIINRFKAIVNLGGIVGKAFKQLIEGDFEGLKQSAKDAGQAVIQFQTGLDVEQQNKFAESISKATVAALKTADAFAKLAVNQRAVRKENRSLSIELEKLQGEEDKFNEIAGDTTKSFIEQQKAAEKARVALEKREQAEVRIAQNTLSLLNKEVALRRSNGEEIEDLLDRQAEAQKTLISAQNSLVLAEIQNDRVRAEIVQARGEKDLDIVRDGFDNLKTINEQIIANERETLERRSSILDETKRLNDEAFEDQIATLQEFTKQTINANDLVNESNSITLNEKIRSLELSEPLEQQLLDTIRDRRSANQDLAVAEQELAVEILERQRAVSEGEAELLIARLEFESEFGANRLQAIKDRTELEIELEKEKTEAILDQEGLTEEERALIRKESEQRLNQIAQEGLNQRIEYLRQESQKFVEFADNVSQLAAAFGDRRTQREEQQLADLEDRNARLLENENLTAEQREAIQKGTDRERAKIEREQARRQRRLAIFNKAVSLAQVTIDGVAAVSKAAAALPFPLNLPGIIAETIRSGLNVATVAATPIPAFAKGTMNAPGGLALVGEAGREIHISKKTGKASMVSGPQLIDTEKGDIVLRNSIVENLLRGTSEGARNERSASAIRKSIREEKSQLMGMHIKEVLRTENKDLVNAIEGIIPEIHQYHFENGKLQKNIRRGNMTYVDVKNENSY